MSIKFQLSDKRGDAILLASAEGDDPQVVEAEFAESVALAGLAQSYEAFAQPAANFQRPTTLGQAQHNVQSIVGGAVRAVAQQPQYQQQPQVPAAAAPSCQHGTKEYKSGEKNGRKWEAWACPAKSSDPTRCAFEWIR